MQTDRQNKPATLPGFSLKAVSAEWLPDDFKLAAYTDGQRWNGWAVPYFPAEAAHSLLAHMPELSYDSERDAFVMTATADDPDGEEFPAQTLVIGGQAVKTYPIGAGSWCWWPED